MTRLLRAIGLATCLAAPMAIPAPAEAQTVIRVCAVNSAGVVIRSRFEYTNRQGQTQLSGWVSNAVGARNCATLQDLTSLLIHVEAFGLFDWNGACRDGLVAHRVNDPRRNATLTVTGSAFNLSCVIQQ